MKNSRNINLMRKFVLAFILLILFITPVFAQFRVLLYHAHSTFNFTESLFTQHMDFLKEHDYHPVTLDQFYGWIKNDDVMPIRPLVISFDDNYIPVYTTAYPILNARGFIAVNFTHTSYVGVVSGSGDHCDWNEIMEMENNHAFLTESHSKTHPNLTTLSESAAKEEIEGSKAAIESNMTSKVCNFIAYPGGNYNSTVITLCQNAGYLGGFTVGNAVNYKTTPLFELKRIGVDGASLETFKDRIGYNALPTPPPGEGWTIDNKEVNFSIQSSGWNESTSDAGYYGNNYLSHDAGDGTHKVRWAAYLPSTSIYHVYAWWTSHPSRTSGAQYEIHHKNGTSLVTVNQKENGGAWNLLGTFEFTVDSAAMIFLNDSPDGSTAADGIWFEPFTSRVTAWIYY